MDIEYDLDVKKEKNLIYIHSRYKFFLHKHPIIYYCINKSIWLNYILF